MPATTPPPPQPQPESLPHAQQAQELPAPQPSLLSQSWLRTAYTCGVLSVGMGSAVLLAFPPVLGVFFAFLGIGLLIVVHMQATLQQRAARRRSAAGRAPYVDTLTPTTDWRGRELRMLLALYDGPESTSATVAQFGPVHGVHMMVLLEAMRGVNPADSDSCPDPDGTARN